MQTHNTTQQEHIDQFLDKIKVKSDKLINYFLAAYFCGGLILSFFYDTWEIAFSVGGLCLVAYYSAKTLLPSSSIYQYVLSAVLGVFMAQFIYQMHGMFEMHFVAFIGSAILITYQNWKLQIPLVLVVVVHHALFGYLQFQGAGNVYFTQLEYMDLQTFIIHVLLAAVIFFICGLWAHHFKKYSEAQIQYTFEMGQLQAEILQRENLKSTNERLNEAQKIAQLGSWERNILTNKIQWSDEMFRIFEIEKETFGHTFEDYFKLIHPEDQAHVQQVTSTYLKEKRSGNYECRILTPKNKIKTIFVDVKMVLDTEGNINRTFGIAHDITERREYERNLEHTNSELGKTNHELDKFVYSVSHDLRAPLLSMLGLAEMIQEESQEESTLENIDMLKGSIHRLDNFIGEILEYSRNARTELKLEAIDFNSLLKELTADLKHMTSEHKNVQLTVDVQSSGIFYSDKRRVSVIINNLVSNAIRYSNPGTTHPFVKITVVADNESACIKVEDNGLGIKEEHQEKIFDMFYRASELSNGSGLGLYIVKEAVGKLQGDVQLQSELEEGSTFEITIPNQFYQ